MSLKYLFTATFPDGTTFVQNPEDVSMLDPNRSAFYDLLESHKPIARFDLTGDGRTYGVDLQTGEFLIGGAYQWMEHDALPEPHDDLRLIYYRQHRHHFKAGSNEQIGHDVTYCLGWQANHEGRNYQQVIGIN